MLRVLLFSAVRPLICAAAGASLMRHVGVPQPAEAQDARIRAEGLSILSGTGVERAQLQTGPGIAAGLYLQDESSARQEPRRDGADPRCK